MHRLRRFIAHVGTASAATLSAAAVITVASVPHNVEIRPLQSTDYDKGFPAILGQLTTVGNVSREDFERRLREIQSNGLIHVRVVEDMGERSIIAAASIIIEPKFTHECGKVGHIEDVVVDASHRGCKLGAMIMDELKRVAAQEGCYKVILSCNQKNVGFYQQLGFRVDEQQMRWDIPPSFASSSSSSSPSSASGKKVQA